MVRISIYLVVMHVHITMVESIALYKYFKRNGHYIMATCVIAIHEAPISEMRYFSVRT